MAAAVNACPVHDKTGPAPEQRYRHLIGDPAWRRLPVEVRKRFSKNLPAGGQTIYRGEVVCMELSRAGWLLAQLARLVGGPLPFTRAATGPCVVTVTEDPALGGQVWSRSYPRPGRFPQVIHSAKRFSGPTGLEEFLGLGLLMRLTVHEEAGRLVFRSAGYAMEFGGRTFRLPDWLVPGRCEVTHRAEADRRFSFTLTLEHSRLGRLVNQVGFFEEV